MMFWLLLVAFTLLVLMLLLRPWATTGSVDVAQDDDRLRISLYQQNLRELDREFERGQLTPEQLANVRKELELSLLGEIGRDTEINSGKIVVLKPQGWRSAALPVVLIIGMAVPLYLTLGNPQLNELKQFSELAAAKQGETAPPVDGVIPEMQTHLQKNPRDANGWLLLADMYMSLEQFPAAVDAFEQLYQLTGEDTNVMLRYANALVVANGGKFSGKPASLVQRVLAIEPDNYTALLFAGMAEDESGNYQQANQHYKNLLPGLQGNTQLLETVNQLIARNEQLLRDAGVDVATTATVEPPSANTEPVSLRVAVTVAAGLSDQYRPDDTVFVYAQALDGPPMPLAVTRNQAGELPLEVVLDDSMAMMPTMKLSAFAKVKLQARISASGNAQPESGDLVGLLAEVDVSTSETINLTIDTVMP